MNTFTTRTIRSGALLAVAALALLGCAAPDDTAAAAPDTAADTVVIEDAWVKAAESGMSAAFGTFVNDSDTDATVVSVASEASGMIELHETVENEAGQLVMREIAGGFVLPAGEDYLLEPGGSHIMLMDLAAPLAPGDEVTFTVTFSDDSTYEFTASVKDYTGANENYEGGDAEMDMSH